MKYEEREFYRFLTRAYIRDGETTHTGEAVLLATLLHTKGNKSKDLSDVQRIMRDRNSR
jgi:hypothetical protein